MADAVVVIGAGPAGLRAAEALVRGGVRPILIDEAERPGGQIYRQPPAGAARPPEALYGFEARKAARVTGAAISTRGLGQRVEDYASVMVRSAGGVLGTIEVGNMNPRVGGDGEWKISGRDALMKVVDDRRMRTVTHDSDETVDIREPEPLALTALRDALDHWRRGEPPPISVQDFVPVAELIDQAYALAASRGSSS